MHSAADGQRASFFPKANAAIPQTKHKPSRLTAVAPVLDAEHADQALNPYSLEITQDVYPTNTDIFAPAVIHQRPDDLRQCGDRYLFPVLTRNERLRLTMLFYYTHGALEDTELQSRLLEKVHFARDTVDWEFVIAGLLNHNTYTRMVGIFDLLSTQNELLQYQLDGPQEALTEKKNMKDKQRVLPLYAHNIEWHGGAKWWSPSSNQEADARMDAQQRYEEEIEAAKATQRELQHTQKLLKQKEKEDNRLRREREKEERGRLRAVKAAEAAERKAHRERYKQARDAEQAVKLPQRGKRKAPQVAAPRKKQKRSGTAARSRRVVHERSPSPPPTYNSRGRKIARRKNLE